MDKQEEKRKKKAERAAMKAARKAAKVRKPPDVSGLTPYLDRRFPSRAPFRFFSSITR